MNNKVILVHNQITQPLYTSNTIFTIGAEPICDLRIQLPEVEDLHLIIDFENEKIEALGDFVKVNSVCLAKGSSVGFREGDKIELFGVYVYVGGLNDEVLTNEIDSANDLKGNSINDLKGNTFNDLKGDPINDLKSDPINDLKSDPINDLKGNTNNDLKENTINNSFFKVDGESKKRKIEEKFKNQKVKIDSHENSINESRIHADINHADINHADNIHADNIHADNINAPTYNKFQVYAPSEVAAKRKSVESELTFNPSCENLRIADSLIKEDQLKNLPTYNSVSANSVSANSVDTKNSPIKTCPIDTPSVENLKTPTNQFPNNFVTNQFLNNFVTNKSETNKIDSNIIETNPQKIKSIETNSIETNSDETNLICQGMKYKKEIIPEKQMNGENNLKTKKENIEVEEVSQINIPHIEFSNNKKNKTEYSTNILGFNNNSHGLNNNISGLREEIENEIAQVVNEEFYANSVNRKENRNIALTDQEIAVNLKSQIEHNDIEMNPPAKKDLHDVVVDKNMIEKTKDIVEGKVIEEIVETREIEITTVKEVSYDETGNKFEDPSTRSDLKEYLREEDLKEANKENLKEDLKENLREGLREGLREENLRENHETARSEYKGDFEISSLGTMYDSILRNSGCASIEEEIENEIKLTNEVIQKTSDKIEQFNESLNEINEIREKKIGDYDKNNVELKEIGIKEIGIKEIGIKEIGIKEIGIKEFNESELGESRDIVDESVVIDDKYEIGGDKNDKREGGLKNGKKEDNELEDDELKDNELKPDENKLEGDAIGLNFSGKELKSDEHELKHPDQKVTEEDEFKSNENSFNTPDNELKTAEDHQLKVETNELKPDELKNDKKGIKAQEKELKQDAEELKNDKKGIKAQENEIKNDENKIASPKKRGRKPKAEKMEILKHEIEEKQQNEIENENAEEGEKLNAADEARVAKRGRPKGTTKRKNEKSRSSNSKRIKK